MVCLCALWDVTVLLRSSSDGSKQGYGLEGSPLVAQAEAVPGTTGLFLVFPSVLCPQPAYGSIQGHCSVSPRLGCSPHWAALCTSDWVNVRSLPGTSHTKRLLSMNCHPKLSPAKKHFPLATLACIICGFPVSLWGACSLHLLLSARHGAMDILCSPLHTLCSAQKKLHAQINQK